MERSRAPTFSCLNCWYRSHEAHRSDNVGGDVYYCFWEPPYRGQNMEGRQRWHRPEVNARLWCGQYMDRRTGDSYDDIWYRHIETKEQGNEG